MKHTYYKTETKHGLVTYHAFKEATYGSVVLFVL